MRRYIVLVLGLASLSFVAPAAQTAIVTGDHSTPLRPVAGAGNVGISNAVMRDQPEVRAVRVVVEPGGARAMHAHTDVKFHLFVPITAAMTLNLDGEPSVAYTECNGGGRIVESADEVGDLAMILNMIRAAALPPRESISLIRKIRSEIADA